jgi:hypothetical protein
MDGHHGLLLCRETSYPFGQEDQWPLQQNGNGCVCGGDSTVVDKRSGPISNSTLKILEVGPYPAPQTKCP